MGKTLVTGATGFLGSHVAHALCERGDDVRLCVREDSRLENLEDLDCERVTCDILDRRALGRALRGVERVFHVAGLTSMRASAEELFRVNVEGTRAVLEACLRAGVERVVYTSSIAAIGPAAPGQAVDERSSFDAARLGIPYVNAKREAEVEALRIAARGLPVVIVNPGHVLGAGDLNRSSTEIVRRFILRRIPAYTDGALNIVGVEDVARGHLAADELGTLGERYILGNRNYTLDRLFADLGRFSGVEPPALKLPVAAGAGPRLRRRAPAGPPGDHHQPRSAPVSQWWTCRNAKAKRELGWRPAPHEDTVEATVAWYRDREGDRLHPRRVAPAHQPADGGDRGAGGGWRGRAPGPAPVRCLTRRPAMATLYRCITPTNLLCPCGRVARELAGRHIPFDEVRVPMRKVRRGEVVELTGQSHVPVLVHDGEVVHDSRRIVEYLEHLDANAAQDARRR